jgi:hypothetical protein
MEKNMKNRAIRTDDALWESVTAAANRQNRGVSEWVRNVLADASQTPHCFHCGDAASHLITGGITKRSDLSFKEAIAIIAEGATPPETYSPVKIAAYTCDTHERSVIDYFLDKDLAVEGKRLVVHKVSCADNWHETGDGGEMYSLPTVGEWASVGYRCPACKEGSVTTWQGVDESDPAYAHLSDAIKELSQTV